MTRKGLFPRILVALIMVQFLVAGFPGDLSASISGQNNLRVNNARGRAGLELINDLSDRDGGNTEDLAERIIVRFTEIGKNDVPIAGGKGANLGELQKVTGITVPDGVAVTTKAFQLHIDKGTVEVGAGRVTLREYIDMRLEGLDYEDSEALAEAGQDIREAIQASEMPDEVKEEITKWYQQLCEEAGVENLPVAVRSSATAEDTEDASFAGQQDTYLNMRGTEEVLDAVKRNWASLFTDRAIFYRHEQGIDHGQAYLSAIIQRMIESKSAGTSFSVHTDTGFPSISVDSAWGIGEGVVSGAANPDSFVVKRDANGEFQIYRKTFGAKLQKVAYRKEANINAKEGTELIDTSEKERSTFSLTDDQVKKVAEAVENIERHYGMYMDVEWGFDANGKLWILQARPETVWNKWRHDNPSTVKMVISGVPEDTIKDLKAVLSGQPAALAAAGTVRILDAEKQGTSLAKELAKVKAGDIIVTTMTKPDMVPAMKRAGAIITDEGGPTCHAAIVARELGIPCVVGTGRTGKATTILKEGQVVTVEANLGKVFEGELAIVEMGDNTDVPALPKTKTKVGLILASPFLAMSMWQFSENPLHYGVGLIREEFAHTTEILVHPLVGLAYDMYFNADTPAEVKAEIKRNIIDDEELRAEIESIIKGYDSFEAFFVDKLANTIATIAAAQVNGQYVILRTCDFKTNEYKNQIGGPLYEPDEKNPMMGYRGINRMLSSAYRHAFELEIEAINKARQAQKNIAVMFPVVRTPEELKEAVELFKEHGLERGKDGFKLGMMVEVPANVFQADEFYQYVDFISIGSNDLTQFTLGLGRDNDKMSRVFNEANPAVKKALEIAIKTTKKYGVISGLCGQRPSNDPAFAGFLVEAGIDSISVVPGAYKNVANVIAEQEKELAGQPLDTSIAGWMISEIEGMPDRVISLDVNAGSILKELDVHPQVLLAYDQGRYRDAQTAADLRALCGNKSAQEYVADTVYELLMSAALDSPGSDALPVYATDDLDKTDYENMRGGKEYEPFDENPQLGFNGLARVVDEDWQEFFRWQVRGIKKAADASDKTLGIRLNLVRTLDEVRTAMDIIREEGLVPGQDVLVGMELSGPSSVLLLKEFIDLGVNFLAENEERFLSYDMAVDPGNPYVVIAENLKENALKNPRRIWTNLAEENNVPLVREAVDMTTALDRRVFRELSAGFDSFARALKDIDTSGSAVMIGARTVLNHAGALEAMRELNDSGFRVVVWSQDKTESETLKKIGAGRVSDIIEAKTADEAVMMMSEAKVVRTDKMAFIHSEEDISKEEVSRLIANNPGIRSVPVNDIYAAAASERINSIPLVFARALAMLLQDQEKVVEKYAEVVQTAYENDMITAEQMEMLNDLTADIAMPLVKASEEIVQAQAAYEETADKI